MGLLQTSSAKDAVATLDALDQSQAMIAFEMDGKVISANKKFLDAFGYTDVEVTGRSHPLFVDAAYAKSEAYLQFWASLRAGKAQVGQFKRIGKAGREVWIEASYNPILDRRVGLLGLSKSPPSSPINR